MRFTAAPATASSQSASDQEASRPDADYGNVSWADLHNVRCSGASDVPDNRLMITNLKRTDLGILNGFNGLAGFFVISGILVCALHRRSVSKSPTMTGPPSDETCGNDMGLSKFGLRIKLGRVTELGIWEWMVAHLSGSAGLLKVTLDGGGKIERVYEVV